MIGHDGAGNGAAWELESIKIECVNDTERYTF